MEWDWSKGNAKVEYQPRRVFGQYGVDFQERVNFDRLRRERLAKLKEQMALHEIAGLLLMLGDNIRYATGTWDQIFRANIQVRYCIVPLKSDPILFETVGCDTDCVKLNAPWMKDRIKPAITYLFTESAFQHQLKRFIDQVIQTLKEEGVNPKEDKIAVDSLDFVTHKAFVDVGVKNLVSGAEALKGARLIKTKDELELLKQACAIADACFYHLKEEWVKPGIRECDIVGKITDFLFSHGIQFSKGAVVASGSNTNPYHRQHTDRIIRKGDMIIIDIANEAYLGYPADFVRCWPVHAKFTKEQKKVYRACYNSLYAAINAMKPGATTADVARGFAPYADDEFKTCSLINFGHSIGISVYEGYWISRGFSLDFPMPIKQNMYFAVETWAGNPGGVDGARLEENLVVTEDGYQCFSLFPFEEEALQDWRF